MKILQGEIGWDITINSIKNENQIMINSPGGSLFEGLAMYDMISNSHIEVGVIGLCASAATLPLLASSKRWGTPNSRYLIHNPSFFIPPSNLNAKELQESADSLKREQDRAVNLYFEKLNGTKEEIQALMDKDMVIDANEALALGLITEIRNYNESKPIEGNNIQNLYTNFKMSINKNFNMEKEEVKQELSGIKLMLDKLAKFFFEPKLLVLQDVNGIELDFGADIETKEQIIIGTSATINGAPATGEFILQDGTKFTFENGTVTEISAPEMPVTEEIKIENEELKVENAALKVENELSKNQLKASIDELANMKSKFESELKLINERMISFQSKFSDEKQEIIIPPVIEPKSKKTHYKL